jgi:hypothetical protein
MATQTKDGLKKFGSSMVAKRYDEFHKASEDGGGMPKGKESSYDGGDQPSAESTPREHGGDNVNTSGPDAKGHEPRDTHAEVGNPSEAVQHHGVADQVTYTHDYEKGEHQVHAKFSDGHEHKAAFKDPALAFEAGGELQSDSVRRRTHPDQSGASSEGDNSEVPQHEAADLS